MQMVKPRWKTARRFLETLNIVWSCNPIPRLRSRENHHSQWHVRLDFQGSTITTVKTRNPPKCPLTEKWRLHGMSIHQTTTQPSKRMKQRYWQQHGWTEKFSNQVRKVREKQTNILRYHTQVRSINSYQWTNVQNRNGLTDWEKHSDYQKKIRREG